MTWIDSDQKDEARDWMIVYARRNRAGRKHRVYLMLRPKLRAGNDDNGDSKPKKKNGETCI